MARRPSPCLLGAMGVAVLGSALVSIGSWLAWPAFGPLYDGPIPGAYVPGTIEQGYQPMDVPTVADQVTEPEI